MTSVKSLYAAKLAAGLQRDIMQDSIVDSMDALVEALRKQSRRVSWASPRQPTQRGLYIWGDVGRGKSMLTHIMIEAVPDLAPRRVHFHTFMRDIHRALHAARTSGVPDPLHAASDQVTRGVTLLILDELEITDIVDAMLVGRVFERVLQQGVALVITSNRPPSDLYRDGLKRDLFMPFVQLLEKHLKILHLDSQRDYRRTKDSDEAHSRWPSDAEARVRISEIWKLGRSEDRGNIQICRNLKLSMRGKVVRGSFDELCRTACTASDYIQLALVADTLLLDNVPRLTAKDDDAARRFIMLIDTCYEAGKDIIIDTASTPEALYDDGSFTQEYRRTVSRLYQMSRPGWVRTAGIR